MSSNSMRHCIALTIFACCIANATQAEDIRHAAEWPSYGADNAGSKYSPLDQINAENFANLELAWAWPTPDRAIIQANPSNRRLARAGFKATPLMVDDTLYLCTGLGIVAAVDASTGETRWTFDTKSYEIGAPASAVGFLTRGVAYWADGDDRRILHGTFDGYLYAINADTGIPIDSFGDHGRADLTLAVPRVDRETPSTLPGGEAFHLSVDSPPTICRDVVVVGSSLSDRPPKKGWVPGYVQAFDVRTGELRWVFHTIPQEGELGTDTWENDSWKTMGNANVWSMMSADEELGYVYLPTSTPTSDYYGADRLGDNLFAESLVCMNAETGERVWHFQMVHHGIWDYDLPAAPNLIDITVDGQRIKAVAQVSKQGFCYVFDRVTGKPVWPIEERPVAPSDVPGERAAPTQPFPTKPPPFERQGISIDDLIDFTPKLRAKAVEEIAHYRIGPIFTPPSLYVEGGTRGTLQLPGNGGGANWSGAAVDPETGILYVPSRTRLHMPVLAEPDPKVSNLKYVRSGTVGPGSIHPARPRRPQGPEGLPILKPPYSRMTAIDLNTGEEAWMTPTGKGTDAIRNHDALKGIALPALGGQGQGGPLLTKTLLIHGLAPAGENDSPALIAYDKVTGRPLAATPIPDNVVGTPMTYSVNGNQYIAMTVGRGAAAQLVALKLP